MKFETPIMEICMFEADDVVTTSGTATLADFDAAKAEAQKMFTNYVDTPKAVVTITF